MKQYFIFFVGFLLISCASPMPSATDVPFYIPATTPPMPQIYVAPSPVPTETPVSILGVKFLTAFSSSEADWQIIPGDVTAAQLNHEVARQEEGKVGRVEQKVINGFLRTAVQQENGQVLEVLSPAELVGGKLSALTLKNVGQVPVLSNHAILLEDYFARNFPDVVQNWVTHGASESDFKYAAVVTVSWATKYGPLYVSYKLSGKYISEVGKYPGRLDFLRLCMFEQTREHFSPEKKLSDNLYPAPIIGLSGTTWDGISGKMQSDAFGWTPMLDVATAESATLNAIGQKVAGVPIQSKETLAVLQSAFDQAFMPVHCAVAIVQ